MSKPTNNEQPVVCLISLGCAKNTVDSERILGLLASSGFLIAENPADAELCLVNTCGFIGDAREETASVLRELAEGRRRGRPCWMPPAARGNGRSRPRRAARPACSSSSSAARLR